jgi:hypothetical protein
VPQLPFVDFFRRKRQIFLVDIVSAYVGVVILLGRRFLLLVILRTVVVYSLEQR